MYCAFHLSPITLTKALQGRFYNPAFFRLREVQLLGQSHTIANPQESGLNQICLAPCFSSVNHAASEITCLQWRVCALRLGHLIWCLFLVLSCELVLKNLVTPYLLPTLGRFCGDVCPVWWQQGAGVTVLDNSIVFFENMMRVSLSPFPTTGVSFRQWGSFLCVTVTQEPFILWSEVLQT